MGYCEYTVCGVPSLLFISIMNLQIKDIEKIKIENVKKNVKDNFDEISFFKYLIKAYPIFRYRGIILKLKKLGLCQQGNLSNLLYNDEILEYALNNLYSKDKTLFESSLKILINIQMYNSNKVKVRVADIIMDFILKKDDIDSLIYTSKYRLDCMDISLCYEMWVSGFYFIKIGEISIPKHLFYNGRKFGEKTRQYIVDILGKYPIYSEFKQSAGISRMYGIHTYGIGLDQLYIDGNIILPRNYIYESTIVNNYQFTDLNLNALPDN